MPEQESATPVVGRGAAGGART
ncbi:Protein of unknown function [Propionibacterium freudenreichii]|nr:Protein of unknown function [Propionibacterium freudenreichii]